MLWVFRPGQVGGDIPKKTFLPNGEEYRLLDKQEQNKTRERHQRRLRLECFYIRLQQLFAAAPYMHREVLSQLLVLGLFGYLAPGHQVVKTRSRREGVVLIPCKECTKNPLISVAGKHAPKHCPILWARPDPTATDCHVTTRAPVLIPVSTPIVSVRTSARTRSALCHNPVPTQLSDHVVQNRYSRRRGHHSTDSVRAGGT